MTPRLLALALLLPLWANNLGAESDSPAFVEASEVMPAGTGIGRGYHPIDDNSTIYSLYTWWNMKAPGAQVVLDRFKQSLEDNPGLDTVLLNESSSRQPRQLSIIVEAGADPDLLRTILRAIIDSGVSAVVDPRNELEAATMYVGAITPPRYQPLDHARFAALLDNEATADDLLAALRAQEPGEEWVRATRPPPAAADGVLLHLDLSKADTPLPGKNLQRTDQGVFLNGYHPSMLIQRSRRIGSSLEIPTPGLSFAQPGFTAVVCPASVSYPRAHPLWMRNTTCLATFGWHDSWFAVDLLPDARLQFLIDGGIVPEKPRTEKGEPLTLTERRWHVLTAVLDMPGKQILCWLDGHSATPIPLDPDYTLKILTKGNASSERILQFHLPMRLGLQSFHGTVAQVWVHNGIPEETTIHERHRTQLAIERPIPEHPDFSAKKPPPIPMQHPGDVHYSRNGDLVRVTIQGRIAVELEPPQRGYQLASLMSTVNKLSDRAMITWIQPGTGLHDSLALFIIDLPIDKAKKIAKYADGKNHRKAAHGQRTMYRIDGTYKMGNGLPNQKPQLKTYPSAVAAIDIDGKSALVITACSKTGKRGPADELLTSVLGSVRIEDLSAQPDGKDESF